MPKVKGQKEYERFKKGERLTYREMVLAMCYTCTGATTKNCDNPDCPLYLSKSPRATTLSPEEQKAVAERLRRGKESKRP